MRVSTTAFLPFALWAALLGHAHPDDYADENKRDNGLPPCPPVDGDGTPLVSSYVVTSSLFSCTYPDAGLCTYLISDGAFSSGSWTCPFRAFAEPISIPSPSASPSAITNASASETENMQPTLSPVSPTSSREGPSHTLSSTNSHCNRREFPSGPIHQVEAEEQLETELLTLQEKMVQIGNHTNASVEGSPEVETQLQATRQQIDMLVRRINALEANSDSVFVSASRGFRKNSGSWKKLLRWELTPRGFCDLPIVVQEVQLWVIISRCNVVDGETEEDDSKAQQRDINSGSPACQLDDRNGTGLGGAVVSSILGLICGDGAGECTYFTSNGSLSSGSSTCPLHATGSVASAIFSVSTSLSASATTVANITTSPASSTVEVTVIVTSSVVVPNSLIPKAKKKSVFQAITHLAHPYLSLSFYSGGPSPGVVAGIVVTVAATSFAVTIILLCRRQLRRSIERSLMRMRGRSGTISPFALMSDPSAMERQRLEIELFAIQEKMVHLEDRQRRTSGATLVSPDLEAQLRRQINMLMSRMNALEANSDSALGLEPPPEYV
ncbi:hypothetical protein B0H19DRAFT_1067648 [Mycena capillaripes]|nr:hypothetical protein B0H19DRAFT_1067648 [Mycena capillaripes]